MRGIQMLRGARNKNATLRLHRKSKKLWSESFVVFGLCLRKSCAL